MTAEQRQNRIITGFVLLSLLLHLLLLLVPKDRLFPVEIAQPPVYVEVRPPQQLERELDLPIREELEQPREKPAERLAEKDQVVEQETAPEGQDTEDLERVVRAPEPAPKMPQPSPPQTEPQPEKPQVEKVEEPRPETVEGWQRPQAKPSPKLPDLETLTQISPQAMASIERDWRRKYREDVESGDTVWTAGDGRMSYASPQYATVSGTLQDVKVEAGDSVQQGTLLAVLQNDELRLSKHRLEQSVVQHE